jgi:hypothetical protein
MVNLTFRGQVLLLPIHPQTKENKEKSRQKEGRAALHLLIEKKSRSRMPLLLLHSLYFRPARRAFGLL